jgi:dTDP-4-dehydrorhamnose reductase
VSVEAIASADLALRARRPCSSVLDCDLVARRFGIATESWRAPLDAAVAHMATGLVSAGKRSNQG